MRWNSFSWGFVFGTVFSIVVWVALLMAVSLVAGCTTYHAKVGEAEITMTYFLQDKNIKKFTFDPNTNTVIIENFGSETSQVVESAVRAALGGVR